MFQGTQQDEVQGTEQQNNRNQEIFEVGPDHIGKQGQVRSSLYRAQVGLFRVFGFSGSCKEVSEGLGNCRDASGDCSGSLRKCLGASGRVQNFSELSQKCFESVTGRNTSRS